MKRLATLTAALALLGTTAAQTAVAAPRTDSNNAPASYRFHSVTPNPYRYGGSLQPNVIRHGSLQPNGLRWGSLQPTGIRHGSLRPHASRFNG